MTEQEDPRRKSRRDLLLILLILPFGCLLMFFIGQAAIRLAPTWLLPVNMFSNLDPDADFAGLGVPQIIEPLDPGILNLPDPDELSANPSGPNSNAIVVENTPQPPVRTPPPPPVINTPDVIIPPPFPTSTIPGVVVLPTKSGPILADLDITKTDNSNTYTPGTTITYTIVVKNNGPDPAPRFDINDSIQANISGLTTNCTPAWRCGTNTSSGNTVSFSNASLEVGEQLSITVSGLVASSTTGNLSNTAEVTIPRGSGFNDVILVNNIATDTDTLYAKADLAITKTSPSNSYTATNPITYTVVVTNNGPSDAQGVRIVDNKPSQIASWTWQCTTVFNAAGCNGVTGSTFNFIDNGVRIQVGGRIEYTVTAYLPTNAYLDTSNIANTARVLIPGSTNYVDLNSSNNSSTDTDIPYIDLQITKTDNGAAFTPNGTIPYTVTVTNNSTFDLTGIGVLDQKPTQITTWSWTCSSGCNPVNNSNSDFTDTIDLAAGSSLVYNVTANVDGSVGLGDTITNEAIVSAPTGLVDADFTNNSASVTTAPYIDLQITKIGGEATYTAGGTVTYTITATNTSNFALSGIAILDQKPDAISTWDWACLSLTNLTCTSSSSSGLASDFTATIDLTATESIQYAVTATIIGNPGDIILGNLVNTAGIDVPTGFVDANYGNNVSSYTHTPGATSFINIGSPDNFYEVVAPDNAYIDILLSPAIVANGDVGTPDFVYYERYSDPANQIVDFDLVEVQISSDGNTWYSVFYWGNGTADTNANLNINVIGSAETDNRPFEYPVDNILYNGRGVTIDIDGYVPSDGTTTYPYMRIISPPGNGDGSDVDAIEILP